MRPHLRPPGPHRAKMVEAVQDSLFQQHRCRQLEAWQLPHRALTRRLRLAQPWGSTGTRFAPRRTALRCKAHLWNHLSRQTLDHCLACERSHPPIQEGLIRCSNGRALDRPQCPQSLQRKRVDGLWIERPPLPTF
jgi:hypothetical protein